jgi:hypothetical protein
MIQLWRERNERAMKVFAPFSASSQTSVGPAKFSAWLRIFLNELTKDELYARGLCLYEAHYPHPGCGPGRPLEPGSPLPADAGNELASLLFPYCFGLSGLVLFLLQLYLLVIACFFVLLLNVRLNLLKERGGTPL